MAYLCGAVTSFSAGNGETLAASPNVQMAETCAAAMLPDCSLDLPLNWDEGAVPKQHPIEVRVYLHGPE